MTRDQSPEAYFQIGDFQVEGRLGEGGMGVVFRARQISLNRPVALKILGAALPTPDALLRFQREAQAAARLRHPGIAAIHCFGQDAQSAYIVMDLVEGRSLRELIRRL